MHSQLYLEKYEFRRLPFGLSKGPDFFIYIICNIFGLDKVSTQGQVSRHMAYLDDILIYSRTEKEHLVMGQGLQMFT